MRELTKEEVCSRQLEILKAVDAFCTTHKYRYFLGYGTLLGAVRHGGYIPWDDDIDLVMLRPEYERFIREFNRDRTDPFRVGHQSIDKDFPYEFAKIYDTETRLVENIDYQYEIGVNIDLFVLDEAASLQQAKKMARKLWMPTRILQARMYFTNREMERQGRPRTGYKKLAAPLLRLFTHCFSVPFCTGKIDHIAKSGKGDFVGGFCERGFRTEQLLKKEWFDRTEQKIFEDGEYPVPAEYDKILTVWYQDYMQLPPLEEQKTHHDYKAYAKEDRPEK